MDRCLVYLDGIGTVDVNTLAGDLYDSSEIQAFDVKLTGGTVEVRAWAQLSWPQWQALLKTSTVRAPDTIEDLA